jgi:hypothetical protein
MVMFLIANLQKRVENPIYVFSDKELRGLSPNSCARDNLRGQKSRGPLEMAQKVIVPQKKIMSRSFLNSGTLIVIKPGQGISRNVILVFLPPCMKMYVSVSDLYIPRICLHIWLQQNRQTDPGNI